MLWRELTTIAQCSQVIDDSFRFPIVVFKHSTRCSTSFVAKGRLEREWSFNDMPTYLIDVIKHREISNKIVADINLPHESPQLIVIKDAQPIYHASHLFISIEDMSKVLFE